MKKNQINNNNISHSADPEELLSRYDFLIEIAIKKYIKTGTIPKSEIDDFRQSINEKLLIKSTKIYSQFKGLSKFSSYLTVIIQNICNELVRSRKVYQKVDFKDLHLKKDESPNPEMNLVIIQEQLKLKYILNLYHHHRPKIILGLKAKFRIPFTYKDFIAFNPEVTKEEYNLCLEEMMMSEENSTKTIYMRLVDVFNKHEEKNVDYDSLRKYINSKISDIIILLNGRPPESNYTEETLQILFEKFCENKNINNK